MPFLNLEIDGKLHQALIKRAGANNRSLKSEATVILQTVLIEEAPESALEARLVSIERRLRALESHLRK